MFDGNALVMFIMVLVVIGLVFTVSNLVGFLRCRMGSSMAGAANQYVQVK